MAEPSFWEYGRRIVNPAGFGAAPEAPAAAPAAAPTRVPTLPQTPDAAAEVARLTRAARVAQYGEAAVAAMERAGSTFGGAAPAAAAPTMTAPSAFARAAPTFAAGFGALGRAAGVVAPAIAPVIEAGRVALSAADPTQSGGETALRGAEGAGRLAGLALGARVPGPWPVKAAAATAGYLAPDLAESASRFVTNLGATPAAAPVVAPAAAPAPVPAGFGAGQRGFQADVRAVDNRLEAPLYPNGAPVTAMTSADIDSGAVPISGTGAIRNNRTGVVTTIDSRDTGGSGTVIDNATGAVSRADGSVGSYLGAVMNQRRAAQTRAERLATEKLRVEGLGKGATAAHSVAQANREALQTAAARAHLEQNPGDFAGAAAVAAGRVLPRDVYTTLPSTTGNDVITTNRASGAVEIVTPKRYVSEDNITASMTARKLTRAQAIAAYKAQGMDVSRIKP